MLNRGGLIAHHRQSGMFAVAVKARFRVPWRKPRCNRSRSGFSILPPGHTSIAFMATSNSVIFERKAVKIQRVWSVVATHPSGQQEHIAGFHTEAEAMEWRVSQGCGAWLRTRGYVGWKLPPQDAG